MWELLNSDRTYCRPLGEGIGVCSARALSGSRLFFDHVRLCIKDLHADDTRPHRLAAVVWFFCSLCYRCCYFRRISFSTTLGRGSKFAQDGTIPMGFPASDGARGRVMKGLRYGFGMCCVGRRQNLPLCFVFASATFMSRPLDGGEATFYAIIYSYRVLEGSPRVAGSFTAH